MWQIQARVLAVSLMWLKLRHSADKPLNVGPAGGSETNDNVIMWSVQHCGVLTSSAEKRKLSITVADFHHVFFSESLKCVERKME
jgi:hypothetical protein